MPAANWETIFALEAAFEPAWNKILEKAGLNTYPEFYDQPKQPPFVDTQLTGLTPSGQFLPGSGGGIVPTSWNATVNTRIVTRRGESSEKQPWMIGRVRIEAMYFGERFTPAVLPFHEVLAFDYTGISRGIDREMDIDWSLLTHSAVIAVREGAFPVRQV